MKISAILKEWKMRDFKSVYGQGYFLYVYLLCIPLFCNWEDGSEILFYGMAIPFVMLVLLSRLCPNCVSDTLRFCPLSRQDIRRYLMASYKLKIEIGTGAVGIVALILVCFMPDTWPVMLLFIWTGSMHATALNLYGIYSEKVRKNQLYWFEAGQVFIQLFGIGVLLVLTQLGADFWNVETWELVMTITIVLIHTLLCLSAKRKYERIIWCSLTEDAVASGRNGE